MPSSYSEIAANGALALIAVATTLLDRQLAAQAEAFEKEGGFAERLYRVRQWNRGRLVRAAERLGNWGSSGGKTGRKEAERAQYIVPLQ